MSDQRHTGKANIGGYVSRETKLTVRELAKQRGMSETGYVEYLVYRDLLGRGAMSPAHVEKLLDDAAIGLLTVRELRADGLMDAPQPAKRVKHASR